MGEWLTPDCGRLEIDGRDCAGEWERIDFGAPALVYSTDNGKSVLRFLGPRGFFLIVDGPSERLRVMVDGGVQVHTVKITVYGQSITQPMQFHKEWTDRINGARRMFGCSVVDRSNEPTWVTESEAGKEPQ